MHCPSVSVSWELPSITKTETFCDHKTLGLNDKALHMADLFSQTSGLFVKKDSFFACALFGVLVTQCEQD